MEAISCLSSAAEIQMMTFNLRFATASDGENHWEKRRSILSACLQQHRPGILATQEGLAFQLEEIKNSLPDFDYVGLGRYFNTPIETRPHENLSGEHCAIFFDSCLFDLQRSATFWLSDTPEIPGSATWGNDLPRIVTWGIFREKSTRLEFAVFNTHFHWGEPIITKSTALLIETIIEIAGQMPIILAGDFNLTAASATHQILTGQKLYPRFPALVDVWLASGHSEETGSTFHDFSGIGRERIDWILVSRHFTVQSCARIEFAIGGRYPSDHFPVMAGLVLNRKN